MSELFKIKGKFQGYEDKIISPTFTAHEATFQIDNRWDGGAKGRLEDVVFQVYGKSMETCKAGLKFMQEAEISFRVGGNKGFVKLTASFITPGTEDPDAF